MAPRALRHHQRKSYFYICKSGRSADLPDLLFSRKKLLLVQRAVAWDRLKGFYKILLRRVCSLLRAKREPERTAVPAGHESPSGAFKPQTGLRSKCRVFSAARSPLLSRRGRRRVAAPCVCFVPQLVQSERGGSSKSLLLSLYKPPALC